MKEDRRIRKTKKVLKESLFELMSKKPITQITVKEIVELSDVNRSTFYHYYTDVQNMVDCIEEDVYQQFVDSIEQTKMKKRELNEVKLSPDTVAMFSVDFITDIGQIAKNNPAFCKCIFSDYGDIGFLNRINDLIELNTKELFYEVFQKKYKNGEYLCSFIKGGLLGILKRWMNNDFSQSSEEISKVIYDFIYTLVVNSVVEKRT